MQMKEANYKRGKRGLKCECVCKDLETSPNEKVGRTFGQAIERRGQTEP